MKKYFKYVRGCLKISFFILFIPVSISIFIFFYIGGAIGSVVLGGCIGWSLGALGFSFLMPLLFVS